MMTGSKFRSFFFFSLILLHFYFDWIFTPFFFFFLLQIGIGIWKKHSNSSLLNLGLVCVMMRLPALRARFPCPQGNGFLWNQGKSVLFFSCFPLRKALHQWLLWDMESSALQKCYLEAGLDAEEMRRKWRWKNCPNLFSSTSKWALSVHWLVRLFLFLCEWSALGLL